jgi:uncharacterized protein (DUF362 family)
MIIKRPADNVVQAAYEVTVELLKNYSPSKPVIIKPNIVEPSPPPTTTDVRVIKGIIKALQEAGISRIMIAEGSGSGDTFENFKKLGYTELEVELIDLDKEKTITLPVKNYNVWEELIVPAIILDKFIISVPVLKEHSMCGVTISLKNMIGILPARYYSGYWLYKKSLVHKYDTHGCIADIINVIKPDWAIVDATIGMKGSHLSGISVKPPLNLVYGSTDPLEADKFGCTLLGVEWKSITYLQLVAQNLSRCDTL